MLAGCGGGATEDEPCPGTLTDGDACGFAGRCWHDDPVSSCTSGWCTCEAGQVHCESIAASDGEACGDEPITSCEYEGTAACDQDPAGGTCACTDGAWACSSGCAEGCPTQRPADAAACTLAEGTACRYWYPAHVSCTCTAGAFQCD